MTITNVRKIAAYQNGNVLVTLLEDGSLMREWEGEEHPEFPCSIDLKITDYCDAGCPFCHEQSTTRGFHASPETILRIAQGLPAGVEIAIGGGNPLDYPSLELLLLALKERGLVANLTVHHSHYMDEENYARLKKYRDTALAWGVGVSVDGPSTINIISQIMPLENLVFHVIAGLVEPQPLMRAKADRLLVLGYKQFGRGAKFYSKKVEANLARWRYWLPSMLANMPLVSFDNLAVEQLGVRGLVTDAAWQRGYMGRDGSFTMYVDAVRDEFAVSSTSPRTKMQGMTARQAFAEVRRHHDAI